jgi:hypothetical protein
MEGDGKQRIPDRLVQEAYIFRACSHAKPPGLNIRIYNDPSLDNNEAFS